MTKNKCDIHSHQKQMIYFEREYLKLLKKFKLNPLKMCITCNECKEIFYFDFRKVKDKVRL